MIKYFCFLVILLFSVQVLAAKQVTPTLRLSSKYLSETDHKERFTISIAYPQLKGKMTDSAENFNEIVKKTAYGFADEFKENVADANKDAGKRDVRNGRSALEVKYEATVYRLNKHNIISILFNLDTFVIGTAYPNTTHQSINYDYEKAESLTLAALFKSDSHYLEKLNTYCGRVLHKQTQVAIDEIKSSYLNYDNWTLQKDGILFTFDDFPHAIGTQQVLVPFKLINDLMINNEAEATTT